MRRPGIIKSSLTPRAFRGLGMPHGGGHHGGGHHGGGHHGGGHHGGGHHGGGGGGGGGGWWNGGGYPYYNGGYPLNPIILDDSNTDQTSSATLTRILAMIQADTKLNDSDKARLSAQVLKTFGSR